MLRRRSFAVGCGLSFCLGVGLFGSVYLMPVFLAFVRRHDAFEIGTIMLVTGVAQLVAAPFAAIAGKPDRRALADRRRLRPVRGRARPERLSAAHRRLRRDVLAANRARRRHHVLPVAADADRARRAAAGGGRGCQRTVQPDAQSRRRHRHRADRYHSVWPQRDLCRRIFASACWRAISARQRRSGSIRPCLPTGRRDRRTMLRWRSSGRWSKRRRWRSASTRPGRCSPASRSWGCCWCRSRATRLSEAETRVENAHQNDRARRSSAAARSAPAADPKAACACGP